MGNTTKVLNTLVGNKKHYTAVVYILWFTAFSVLIVLCTMNCIQLVTEYVLSKPTVSMRQFDNSTNGIRLPNGTLCLVFSTNKEINVSTQSLSANFYERLTTLENTMKSEYLSIIHDS